MDGDFFKYQFAKAFQSVLRDDIAFLQQTKTMPLLRSSNAPVIAGESTQMRGKRSSASNRTASTRPAWRACAAGEAPLTAYSSARRGRLEILNGCESVRCSFQRSEISMVGRSEFSSFSNV
jgi:hypothetical protein